jgi:hypothetical protein
MPLKGIRAVHVHSWLALGLAMLGTSAVAENSFRITASAGVGYDANVANAEKGGPIPATGIGSASLGMQYSIPMPLNTQLVLRGTVSGEQYFHYVGLSNGTTTALARLLYRPGGGFYAPLLSIWGSADEARFGSRMRNSADYRGGAFVREQLTTDIALRLGGTYAERHSKSNVFDLRGQTASLDIDWQLTPSLTSYLGYAYRYGDVFSTGVPTLKVVEAAKVIEADDAFGGATADEFAYRFKGHSQIGTLGFNYAISPRLSIDLQGTNNNTRAGWGNHYNHPSGMLSLLTRF